MELHVATDSRHGEEGSRLGKRRRAVLLVYTKVKRPEVYLLAVASKRAKIRVAKKPAKGFIVSLKVVLA